MKFKILTLFLVFTLLLILFNLNQVNAEANQKFLISFTPFILNKFSFKENYNVEGSKFIIYTANAQDPCKLNRKIVDVNFYGVTSKGNFEVYYTSDIKFSETMFRIVDEVAEEVYYKLISFFNTTPLDQDKNGRVEILFANLNEEGIQGIGISGYTNPGGDENGKSLIYIDITLLKIDLIANSKINLFSTISHELTHLIQASIINLGNEELWIIEGIAEWISDYVIEGFNPSYSSLRLLSKYKNIPLNKEFRCRDVESYVANYVMSYVFFEFLVEKYGTSIIKEVLSKTKEYDGIKVIEAATKSDFLDLYLEFSVKNYLNDYKGTKTTFEETNLFILPSEKILKGIYFVNINKLAIDYFEIDFNKDSILIFSNLNLKLGFSLIKIYDDNKTKILKFKDFKEKFIIIKNENLRRIILVIVRGIDSGNGTFYLMNLNVKRLIETNLEKGMNEINNEDISVLINSKEKGKLYIIELEKIYIEKIKSFNEIIYKQYIIFSDLNDEKINYPILIKLKNNLKNDFKIYYFDFSKMSFKKVSDDLTFETNNLGLFSINLNLEIKIFGINLEKIALILTIIFILAIFAFILTKEL